MDYESQIIKLFILALPIACVSWTWTHEEVFKGSREWLRGLAGDKHSLLRRKFIYILFCEYCFSFYVTATFLLITGFQLLYSDWRGYLIAELALVWISNLYMNIHFALRIDIKKKGVEAKVEERALETESEIKK